MSPTDAARTTPVAHAGPGVRRAAVIGAVLVGLTVLRPWGGGPDRPAAAPALAAHAAAREIGSPSAPAATPSAPPSLAPDQASCSASGWQLVSLDHLGDWTVRGWVPAQAARATDPLDASIPTTTLDSPAVLALGVCTPPIGGPESALLGGAAPVVRAWRLLAGAAEPVELVASPDQGARPEVAYLYRQVGPRSATLDAWPAGRYVLAVDGGPSERPVPAGPGWLVGVVIRSR